MGDPLRSATTFLSDLRAKRPQREGRALALPTRAAPYLLIGRGPDCDLVIDDATVSRHHAALALVGGEWFIIDRGSTNGTWLNGRRIWGTASVRPGDRLRLGRPSLLLELAGP